ncbi:calaxin isoform X2 [Syngnathoides biaculeatus]|uniref:calaxin isoform X2 n=1 Tax=Syngnathoides biaculeatus TaxID=300417 RepID=UPI002ADE0ABD|nr:calaxin isoform X2 [Syngnathoides biaculeatus]
MEVEKLSARHLWTHERHHHGCRWHGGSAAKALASEFGGPGFNPCLCGVCIFSPCLRGFPPVFRTFDKDNDGFVGLREWIEGLAIVLRGTLDERIKYCFHVYDLNADKYISREEMLQMLRYSLRLPGEEDPYDGIKDLVEITLKRMDHDHDDRLSLDDFEKSVKAMNHMLEAFGNCLPNTTRIETFEQRVFQSPVHW